MIWRCLLGTHALFLLFPMRALKGREVSPTSALYNAAKLCELIGCMECKGVKGEGVIGVIDVFRKRN